MATWFTFQQARLTSVLVVSLIFDCVYQCVLANKTGKGEAKIPPGPAVLDIEEMRELLCLTKLALQLLRDGVLPQIGSRPLSHDERPRDHVIGRLTRSARAREDHVTYICCLEGSRRQR